jgi:exonuclease III
MPHIYKIATININGISSDNRILWLSDFLFKHDIYIALLHEVTTTKLTCIRNYTVLENIGTEGRGTAILSKPGINLTGIKRLPSGRGIDASLYGTTIVNIYAPSGAERKADRECFFTQEILPLIPSDCTELILASDFNCILNNSECTGKWMNQPIISDPST